MAPGDPGFETKERAAAFVAAREPGAVVPPGRPRRFASPCGRDTRSDSYSPFGTLRRVRFGPSTGSRPMLNYVWSGLIVASFAFALGADARDLGRDTYRNGRALPLEVIVPQDYDPSRRLVPVEIRIDQDAYRAFYGTEDAPSGPYLGTLVQTAHGRQLRFDAGAVLPEPLATIQGVSRSEGGELQGTLATFDAAVAARAAELARLSGGSPAVQASVRFEPVRFVRLNAIGAAALDFAETAAEIALGLVGVLALFLGLLEIGRRAGVVEALVRFVRPALSPLFPEIPKDHPALGMIALNLSANVLGLGNAATPFGIKAMEELQRLNPRKDTATNSMVMLLAINTASVQLMPPVLLLALLGLQINQLFFPIVLTTSLSLVVAIVAVRVYGRLPGNRASDPHRSGTAEGSTPPGTGA
jgi:spore maturation protein A